LFIVVGDPQRRSRPGAADDGGGCGHGVWDQYRPTGVRARRFAGLVRRADPTRSSATCAASNAARGLPRRFAPALIASRRVRSASRRESFSGSVAALFTLMAAPFSSRKSLLRLSCPGIGLTITIAAPRANTSDVVSPPGLDTTT